MERAQRDRARGVGDRVLRRRTAQRHRRRPAFIQAVAQRGVAVAPDELALLLRRNMTALAAAGLTMFAAGAALPGHASALILLAGPTVACVAFATALHTRGLTRRLTGARKAAARSPL